MRLLRYIPFPLRSPRNLINQNDRRDFAERYQDSTFGGTGSDTLWVDIDEKNFYLYDDRPAHLYTTAERAEELKYRHRNSKTKITNVMFLVAVARPRTTQDYTFDGRVLLMPIVAPVLQERRSDYTARDATRYEPMSMTVYTFQQILRKELIPAIQKIIRRDNSIRNVVIQLDNAGAHGGGRKNMDDTLSEMNKWRECRYRYQTTKADRTSRVRFH